MRVTNTFKVEAWHSMVITRNTHHPVNLTQETVIYLLQEAVEWIYDVTQENEAYK